MGVDRGRLALPALRSTRRLHDQHQQSYLSSLDQARVAERGGRGAGVFLLRRCGMSQLRCPWAHGCGSSSFVYRGSREGRAGGEVGGPGQARGPRTRSKSNLGLPFGGLRASPAVARLAKKHSDLRVCKLWRAQMLCITRVSPNHPNISPLLENQGPRHAVFLSTGSTDGRGTHLHTSDVIQVPTSTGDKEERQGVMGI